MYKQNKPQNSSLQINESSEGETIEAKMRRIVNNKEPITDGAPLIYTDRKDGVQPDYDIRTDRWEVAIDAMDKVTASKQAKREQRLGERTYDTMTTDQQETFNKKYPTNRHAKTKNPETGANTSDSK